MKALTYIALTLATGVALADTTPVTTSADIAINSKYVWRGINITDDVVVQPSFTFGWQKWSLNLWGNYETTNVNGFKNRFTEVDTTLTYSDTAANGTWSAGVINYAFPNTGGSDTTEFFGTYTFGQAFNPTVGLYWDVDEANGIYLNFSASDTKDVPGTPGASWGWNASVGYGTEDHNQFYYGSNKASLADWKLGGVFNLPAGNGTAYFNTAFTGLLDSKLRQGASNRSNWVIGAGYKISF